MRGSIAFAEQMMTANVSPKLSFEIPAQSLDAALLAFSTVTGVELVYDSKLIGRLASSDVRGDFTADDAVAQMLKGSGLYARKIAAKTITILRESESGRAALRRSPEQDPHAAYFAAIQESLNEAFCDGGLARTNGQRLVMRFRVDPSGEIKQLEVLDLSDRNRPSTAIADALSRLTFKKPPPADLPQPLMVLIRPTAGAEDLQCAPRH